MRQWQAMTPIGDHYHHVLDFAEAEGIDEDDELWRFEWSAVSAIDTFQVITDENDSDGIAKVAKFRKLHAEDVSLPPIVLQHCEDTGRGELFLWDGRRRFNAALQDERDEICAWVLHYGDCSCLSGGIMA